MKKPLIQSLERALDVLDLCAESEEALRSNDIAEKLELKVSTTNNIVRSLYRRGYLAQSEEGKYLLGAQCHRLGLVCDRWADLRRVALPIMQKLSHETGLVSFLGVEKDNTLFCAAYTQGGPNLMAKENQNWWNQIHSTAAGKTLLAFMDKTQAEKILSTNVLPKLTPQTVTDKDRLLKEAEHNRKLGFAISHNESAEEVSAIGVPVKDHNGRFIAALAQSFPSFYLESKKIIPQKHAEILNRYAGKISTQLNAENNDD